MLRFIVVSVVSQSSSIVADVSGSYFVSSLLRGCWERDGNDEEPEVKREGNAEGMEDEGSVDHVEAKRGMSE